MKNITSILVILISVFAYSQEKSNLQSTYFLPSNSSITDLNPSDIPSEQVLREMGLTEEEIKDALDYKYQRNKNDDNESQESSFNENSRKFYKDIEKEYSSLDTVIYPRAKVYGQDIFRNNSINYFQKSLDGNAPKNYRIGPGDQLSISVWGNSDFSDAVTVDKKGYISISGFGRVYVKGLTYEDTKSLIRKRLGMSASQMDISLIYSRVILINIVGEVYNPGSYVMPAINTAFNALMAAKGPTQIGSVRNIYIKRSGKIIDSLDIYQFLFDPENYRDIYLQDGDYIVVSPSSNLVEVKGEVNRPYTYEIKSTDNVADLIEYAGGYSRNASRNIITLKRFDISVDRFIINDIHQSDLSTTSLRGADEIIINKIQSKTGNYISLEGTIGVNGNYEFIKGEKLLEFLERSSCLNEYLYTENIYILRLNNDRKRSHISVNLSKVLKNPSLVENIELKEFDIIKVMSIDDFDEDYIVSIFGSVRKEGEYSYGSGMLLQDLLNLSGGIKEEASGSRIEVSRVMEFNEGNINTERSIVLNRDILDDLSVDDSSANFVLQANDQVFIRKNPDYKEPINVFVSGEVRYPGVYPIISQGDRVSDIIDRAGGVTDFAFIKGVRLYRSIDTEDDQHNTSLLKKDTFQYNIVSFDLEKVLSSSKSKHNLTLQEGDSLVVPSSVDIVYITGDLFNYDRSGISVPYISSKRADFYIRNFAGGYSEENDRNNTIVIYPDGSVRKSINLGLFNLSPKVTVGSTIKISSNNNLEQVERIPLDWNVAIEKTLIKVTGILSLYLLVDRIQGSF